MTRAVAALLVVAACDVAPATSERTAAIIGGTLDPADDAVVALVSRTRSCGERAHAACTGTLIAPRAVLTAAHCVANESPATLVVVAGPTIETAARIEIDAIDVHPAYDGFSSDLAILTLADAPAIATLGLRETPLGPAEIGASVRVVGFGIGDDGLTGVKRHGTARVTDVTASTLVLAPDPALPCGGDSGGPVLIADQVVGVIAFGDPGCAISGTSVRIDIHLDAFVRPVLARIAATAGSSRALFDPDARSCMTCEVTDDCPRGTACVDGTCAILGGELGRLGATCTSDMTCGDSPCVAGLDETACRCLSRCATGGSSCAVDGRSGNLSFAFLLALVTTIVSRRRTTAAGDAERGPLRNVPQTLP